MALLGWEQKTKWARLMERGSTNFMGWRLGRPGREWPARPALRWGRQLVAGVGEGGLGQKERAVGAKNGERGVIALHILD